MKTKHYSLLLLAGIMHANAFAQPVIITQRAAGGSSSDAFACMALTKDGGLIAGGYSYSNSSGEKTENNRGPFGTPDYWIVKYDNGHNIQWDKTIGGSSQDYLTSLQQTNDGGYILGGWSFSDISGEKTENRRGGGDYWLVKLDGSGKIQWDKTIGGDGDDHLTSLQQTSDGGYILGGESSSGISGEKTENGWGGYDYWVVKLNSSGKIQWDKTIGGTDYEIFTSLQQTSDGGYILGGWSQSNISGEKTENSRGGYDYWIIRLDNKGNIQWDKTIGGNDADYLSSLQQTGDGGYILGGYSAGDIFGEKTENSRGDEDYWVVKLDNKGIIQWDKTIGGSDFDDFTSLQQTSDGGYILGGISTSGISGEKTENNRGPSYTEDYWIVKLKANGKVQWDKTIGGCKSDECYSIKEMGRNRYVAGGYSFSGANGDKKRKSRGEADYWLVWLCDGAGNHTLTATSENIASITIPNPASKTFSIFPNPAKDILHIQSNTKAIISLTDASGKTILSQTVNGKGEMNTSRLMPGVYFVKNHATGEVQKVVVER